MPHFVGLDASKATTSICILNEDGQCVREGVVETEPRRIAAYLRGDGLRYRRVGIESTSFTPWIYEGLAKAGLPVVCIHAPHAHGLLKARLNKTDRNDARGIAEIMRGGHYKAVHIKTPASREAKLVLNARRQLKLKCRDIDNLIRGCLLQFGIKAPRASVSRFDRATKGLIPHGSRLGEVVESLFSIHRAIEAQVAAMGVMIEQVAANDAVCQRFMTVPGVGALTALAYRAAVDVPERFARSRNVGVHLGLTSRTYQSGETERRGRISKCGDSSARAALFMAARSLMNDRTRPNALKLWGQEVIRLRGYMRGLVAVARRLAVILHRMWLDGTEFRTGLPVG